jgi:predicted HTH transcriptional regulator
MGAIPSSDLDGHESIKERVNAALSLLAESRSVEFKGPEKWETLGPGLAKDVLAISNIRDGGIIIIGVEKTGQICGLSKEQLETYDTDVMIDFINKYASPSIAIDIVTHKYQTEGISERILLIIQIHEFEELPIICKKGNSGELKQAGVYFRPIGKPESRLIREESEMKELLEIALEKKLKKWLVQQKRIGLNLEQTGQSNKDEFEEELGGL